MTGRQLNLYKFFSYLEDNHGNNISNINNSIIITNEVKTNLIDLKDENLDNSDLLLDNFNNLIEETYKTLSSDSLSRSFINY